MESSVGEGEPLVQDEAYQVDQELLFWALTPHFLSAKEAEQEIASLRHLAWLSNQNNRPWQYFSDCLEYGDIFTAVVEALSDRPLPDDDLYKPRGSFFQN